MPTNRRPRKLTRRQTYIGLTDEIERTLQTGSCFFEQPSLDMLQQAWKEHGDTILREWIATQPPGTRPFAWWLFVGVPTWGERRTTEYFQREHARHRAGLEKYGVLSTHTIPLMQEPEAAFLFRVGVIDEAEYLDAKALYDADHDVEVEFLDGVLQRVAELERKRLQRVGGCDGAETEAGEATR